MNPPMNPREWSYGLDFAEQAGAARVVAVRIGDGDRKYGLDWHGPVDASNPTTLDALEEWAALRLLYGGGYVHLFPADGDALEELESELEESDAKEFGEFGGLLGERALEARRRRLSRPVQRLSNWTAKGRE